MAKNDWTSGQRFGMIMLTGKSYLQQMSNGKNRRFVEIICECGKINWSRWDTIKQGKCNSCGCVHIERLKTQKPATTHGLHRHPLFNVWCGMNQRCYDVNYEAYANYGFKGVNVCDEWRHNFKLFHDWSLSNGWKRGLQLDKDIKYKEVHKTEMGFLYSPEYCLFVTPKVNSRNRTTSTILEYNRQNKTLAEWADIFNINPSTLCQRIYRSKWSVEKSLTTPVKQYK